MDYLTTAEVARLRDVTQASVLKSIREGRLPAVKIPLGNRLVWRILRTDAETYQIYYQGMPKGAPLPNPSGLCMCGCGERTPLAVKTGRGNYKGYPARFIQGHNNLAKHPLKYVVDPDTGCWVWQRAMNRDGYGAYKGMKAHRYFYEQQYGKIPDGLDIDHLCRNPSCVNPEHLEAVTTSENVRRGLSPKINIEIAREIRRLRAAENLPYSELGRKFGISGGMVRNICHNISWRED